ncbi:MULTISPECIES: hypothetical protein [Pseudoalteromonas]|uniref:Uncharacterized protein n=1 Tax=Pseudoalteromonas gelatinilytica TaxID=1703256 RepID=A0ABQ1U080_9GAMM|nr:MULTISPECIES: hypothetical protein [Pseudoalteromonas]MCP4589051.1 hypothetical protein [Pseudoalteromonas sp.]GGF07270.1 hypothetical protein GCM10008027_35220 [Pseudoalteromonas profundi]
MSTETFRVRVNGYPMVTSSSYKKALNSFNKAKINNAGSKVEFIKEETLAVHQPINQSA